MVTDLTSKWYKGNLHTHTTNSDGDAECDEGSIWESVMFAGRNKLNNLITIVDRNWMSVMDKFDKNSIAKKKAVTRAGKKAA